MKHRMHKRVETKPDGRRIYYYTFEPVETDDAPANNAPCETAPREAQPSAEPTPAGAD